MKGPVLFVLFSLGHSFSCMLVPIEPTRVKRGIFGTITSTIYETVTEKHYVPSTCVHVEPNLPDCRNVRFLNWPSFTGANSFLSNNSIAAPSENGNTNGTVAVTKRISTDHHQEQTVHIQGWAEYLGLDRPTVTVTEIKIVPTTVLDSRIMVTYAIKGCKPHHLPEHLERCPEDRAEEIEIIAPTNPILSAIQNTDIPESNVLAHQPELFLEGAEMETCHPHWQSTRQFDDIVDRGRREKRFCLCIDNYINK
ncbi:uncharacterized protein LOC143203530 isoform X1 [Rhynchophorus ferrugineus]|uniref:uncharacterized protein LOC143203530 isoform X1 n=1 Tax=Rhynchophorus ferrugineus TaxID=354439 RepID=UPI003FCC7224